jgi:hypothetical protein
LGPLRSTRPNCEPNRRSRTNQITRRVEQARQNTTSERHTRCCLLGLVCLNLTPARQHKLSPPPHTALNAPPSLPSNFVRPPCPIGCASVSLFDPRVVSPSTRLGRYCCLTGVRRLSNQTAPLGRLGRVLFNTPGARRRPGGRSARTSVQACHDVVSVNSVLAPDPCV